MNDARPLASPSSPTAPSPLRWGEAPALDAFETLMWRLDEYPNLRSAVVGVELLDRAPDRARLRAAHAWGSRAVPRLRHKLVEVPLGTPEWCEDPRFDLDAHLDFVTLPAPGSVRQLLDLAQSYAMEPFDRTRPPWSAVVVEGLEGGRAAYVLKLHHAMTDGIGIVQLLSFMHSDQRAPRADRAQPPPLAAAAEPTKTRALLRQARREIGAAPARLRRTLDSVRDALRPDHAGESRLSRLARYAASLGRTMAPYMAPPSPLFAARNHQWRFECLELPLPALKAAAKASGASLNDAFVSGLLGGVRRYHQHFGVEVEEIPIVMPISVRSADDVGGGNRFAPGQLSGPVAEADPVRRMKLIGEQVARLREEPALLAPLALMPLLARLPAPLVAKAMGPKMAANDLQISNVPGIREPVFMAGAEVTHMFPFAPLPGVPGMIALVSHGQTCCIGMNLDQAAIADPDRWMACMRESFDEVLALGRK